MQAEKTEVPKELWKSYSAFANTISGLILLGIEEHMKETDPAKRFEIIGEENPQKILTDFWNTINSEKVSENILADKDVEVVDMDGKKGVCIHVPRLFRMEGLQRVDNTPEHKAVREAFTNAINHADLMADAGILRIEKHDDKLCFRNPGLLRLPIEQIYEGGNSKARTPRIQNMLHMIGFGENLGAGFPKILAAWKETDWGEPELINKIELDEVELVLPVKGDPRSDPKKLTSQERLGRILEIINDNPQITREEIGEILGVGHTTIMKDFRILKEEYGVCHEGSSKTGRWVHNKE